MLRTPLCKEFPYKEIKKFSNTEDVFRRPFEAAFPFIRNCPHVGNFGKRFQPRAFFPKVIYLAVVLVVLVEPTTDSVAH